MIEETQWLEPVPPKRKRKRISAARWVAYGALLGVLGIGGGWGIGMLTASGPQKVNTATAPAALYASQTMAPLPVLPVPVQTTPRTAQATRTVIHTATPVPTSHVAVLTVTATASPTEAPCQTRTESPTSSAPSGSPSPSPSSTPTGDSSALTTPNTPTPKRCNS